MDIKTLYPCKLAGLSWEGMPFFSRVDGLSSWSELSFRTHLVR